MVDILVNEPEKAGKIMETMAEYDDSVKEFLNFSNFDEKEKELMNLMFAIMGSDDGVYQGTQLKLNG